MREGRSDYWSKKLLISLERLGCFRVVLASPPDWLRAPRPQRLGLNMWKALLVEE